MYFPTDVTVPLGRVVSIYLDESYSTAITADGAVKCWGSNLYGKLGSGSGDSNTSNIVDVLGLTSGVVTISSSWWHTCALTSTGQVKCWGKNGDGSTTDLNSPVDVRW